MAIGIGLHRDQDSAAGAHRLADGRQIGPDVIQVDEDVGLIEHVPIIHRANGSPIPAYSRPVCISSGTVWAKLWP